MPDRSVSLPMSKNTGSGWREKSIGQKREKQRETEVKGVTSIKIPLLSWRILEAKIDQIFLEILEL